MRNQNTLLYVGAFCITTFFSGCGGGDHTSSMNTSVGTVKGTGPITINIPETISGEISDSLKTIIKKIDIKDIKQSNVDDIVALMNNNYPIKINIEYSFYHDTDSRKKYCYSLMKANNKIIGENFILFNSRDYEGATRIVSKGINRYDGTALFVSPLSKLWLNYSDKNIINDSLSSIDSNTENHTVSFDFTHKYNGDYYFSNLYISNILRNRNSYTLKSNKRKNSDPDIEETQLLLTTLFTNFNRSYTILD